MSSSNFASQFADFQSTSSDTYAAKDPNIREFTDRAAPFKDVAILNPKKEVRSHVRLIPWPGLGYFARQVRMHFGVGPDKVTFPCLCMLGEGVSCPSCVKARYYYGLGDKKMGGIFNSKVRHLCWVIDRNEPEKGPQLWQIPDQTINSIRSMMLDPRTGAVRSVDHIENGFDLFFVKRAETAQSPYLTINDIQLDFNPSALGTQEQLYLWFDYIRNHPFESLPNYPTRERVNELVDATDGSGADDAFVPPTTTAQAAASATPGALSQAATNFQYPAPVQQPSGYPAVPPAPQAPATPQYAQPSSPQYPPAQPQAQYAPQPAPQAAPVSAPIAPPAAHVAPPQSAPVAPPQGYVDPAQQTYPQPGAIPPSPAPTAPPAIDVEAIKRNMMNALTAAQQPPQPPTQQ